MQENIIVDSQVSESAPEGEPPQQVNLSKEAEELLAVFRQVANIGDHQTRKRLLDGILRNEPVAAHELDKVLLQRNIPFALAAKVHGAVLEILSHPVCTQDERILCVARGTEKRAAGILRQAGLMAG